MWKCSHSWYKTKRSSVYSHSQEWTRQDQNYLQRSRNLESNSKGINQFRYFWSCFSETLKQSINMFLLWFFFLETYAIQIKICAEYRDRLPRPRLVCQEPGLRPIGRSPGVPDKSSRGLGSLSRYSAQILICFIAYIFLFFLIPLWVWLGTLQDCQCAQCPLPFSIVIRMRLVIRQSNLPAWLAEVQLVHQNTL